MKLQQTSFDAYWSVQGDLSAQQARVFAAIQKSGVRGATCDEVEESLGGRHQSISARFNDLAKRGVIVDSGLRRLTRSGRKAIVWRVQGGTT